MPGSAGRPCPAVGSLIPWRSWGGWGFNGGHLEWGGGGSPARGGSRSMHSSTIDAPVPSRAVLRVPHMRSTAGPRRIGSVVVLCMLGAPRPVPGRTAPPSGAAVTTPGAPATRPRDDPPHLRCRRLTPRAATRPRDDHTHPQVPPLNPRAPRHRPRGPLHPPQVPAVIRPELHPRTDDRVHARRARMPGGTGPMDVERSETQKTAIAGGRTRAWRSDGSGSPCRRSRGASRGATAAPRSRRRPCAGRASSGPRARLGRRGPGSSPST